MLLASCLIITFTILSVLRTNARPIAASRAGSVMVAVLSAILAGAYECEVKVSREGKSTPWAKDK